MGIHMGDQGLPYNGSLIQMGNEGNKKAGQSDQSPLTELETCLFYGLSFQFLSFSPPIPETWDAPIGGLTPTIHPFTGKLKTIFFWEFVACAGLPT